MTSSPPHLVSLVLQSKKALQHGEQLCSRANALSNDSAQCAMDVLALDAKVRWITDAVLEQLKLAASVAKSIEQKRAQLDKQLQEWDTTRTLRTSSLDTILEFLGTQLVPPDFYQISSESSLFGSQLSAQGPQISMVTLKSPGKEDRKRWKTLRDFVDERAIEDVLETVESDRSALDDVLGTTDEYPESLTASIAAIRNNLPPMTSSPSIEGILNSQETASTDLASRLESLAAHYDQMAGALRESEAGEAFSKEDLSSMNRDTEELPAIMAELEESAKSIERSHAKLLAAREGARLQVESQRGTLDDLDELGDIMAEMLQRQETVEAEFTDHLGGLQQHLMALEDLHHRFLSYRVAFDKLLVEISRRRQYREAAQNVVSGMATQLELMSEEERQLRVKFNDEHGAYFPADLCLCIENLPTKWEITPQNGEAAEVLPHIDNDLLLQAMSRVSEGIYVGAESV